VSLGPLALVLYAGSPKPGDYGHNCGGIGFGEVPCGWDAVAFTFIFLGVPYAVIYAGVVGSSELLGGRFTLGRSIIALVGASVPWVLAALAAISG
jgi:hypothetical protein